MSKVLVGRDATAYTISGGGIDTTSSGAVQGSPNNILGQWKDISVTVSKDWEEVTSSGAERKEKRRTVMDWKARLSNQIRSGGSIGLALILNNDYIFVSFTEEATGKVINLIGGMTEDEYSRDRGEAKDTLSIENVGDYNGQSSIGYA